MNKDVHTEHCCVEHGCKYGEEDFCPVWLGYKPQSHPCESCDWDTDVIPQVFVQRRLKADNNQWR